MSRNSHDAFPRYPAGIYEDKEVLIVVTAVQRYNYIETG